MDSHVYVKRGFTSTTFYKERFYYLMLLPVLIWYGVFAYAPMYGIFLAFQKFSYSKGFLRSPFVGLANFQELLSDPFFIEAVRNTFIINGLRILFGFPVPILFAILLNEVRHSAYKRTVQTVTYLPHFISWVVLAGILNSLLARDTGAISSVLAFFGVPPREYLMDNSVFRTILVVSEIWKEMGWNTIIYLASISAIDPTLYEAAIVDGADRRQMIWHITIPCLRPTMVIMLLLLLGNIANMGFDQIFNMYNGAVFETADIIDTYIIRNLQMNPQYGVLAAAGLIKSVICFLMLVTANKLVHLAGEEGLYR